MDYSYKEAIAAESYRWLKTKTLEHCERMKALGATNMSLIDGSMADKDTQYSQERIDADNAIYADLDRRRREARLNQEMHPKAKQELTGFLAELERYVRQSATLDMRVPVATDPPPSWVKQYLNYMDKSSGTTYAPRTEDERWACLSGVSTKRQGQGRIIGVENKDAGNL